MIRWYVIIGLYIIGERYGCLGVVFLDFWFVWFFDRDV